MLMMPLITHRANNFSGNLMVKITGEKVISKIRMLDFNQDAQDWNKFAD